MPSNPATSRFPTTLDTTNSVPQAANNRATTLTISVSADATTLPVASTASFPASGAVTIGSEIIFYSAVGANSLASCVRGYDGTTATTHAGGDVVEMLVIAAHTNIVATGLIAVEAKLGSGASMPVAGTVLQATGTGTTEWGTLDASNIVSGTLDVARIPVLPSGKQIISSGDLSALTVAQQNEIGTGTMVVVTDGRRWIYKGTGSKTIESSYILSSDITPDWSEVQNKPAFGNSATRDVGTLAGTVAAGNDPRIVDPIATIARFGRKIPYQHQIDDFFFEADKRFGVTFTGFTSVYPAALFDGVYAGGSVIDVGQTAIINIDLLSKGEYGPQTSGITYLQGFLFVSFYYTFIPLQVSAKVKTFDGVWRDCQAGEAVGVADSQIWRMALPGGNYGVAFEITVVARADGQAWINEIECFLREPDFEASSLLSRSFPQNIYHPWSWRDNNNIQKAEISSGTGRLYTVADVVVDNANRGIVLKSPNGHYWRQTISDSGIVSWVDIGTGIPA